MSASIEEPIDVTLNADVMKLIKLCDELEEQMKGRPVWSGPAYIRGATYLGDSTLAEALETCNPDSSHLHLYQPNGEEFLLGNGQLERAMISLTSRGLSKISIITLSNDPELLQKLAAFKKDLGTRATLETRFVDCQNLSVPASSPGLSYQAGRLAKRHLEWQSETPFMVGENLKCYWAPHTHEYGKLKGYQCMYHNTKVCETSVDYKITAENHLNWLREISVPLALD